MRAAGCLRIPPTIVSEALSTIVAGVADFSAPPALLAFYLTPVSANR